MACLVKEGFKRLSEFLFALRPFIPVSTIGARLHVVIDLFLITPTLGELPIVITEWLIGRSQHTTFEAYWLLKEVLRHPPHIVDDIVETVISQNKKSVVTAGGI